MTFCSTWINYIYFLFKLLLFKILDNEKIKNLFLCVFNRYQDVFKNVIQNAEVKKEIEQFDNLMDITSKYAGTNITTLLDLVRLYSVLHTESSMGLTLHKWTQDIFPNGKLLNATLLMFNLLSYDQLNNLNGGMFK